MNRFLSAIVMRLLGPFACFVHSGGRVYAISIAGRIIWTSNRSLFH